MNQQEFDRKLNKLGESLPLVASLLKIKPFDEWPEHLKKDAYERIGVLPETIFVPAQGEQ